MNRIILITCLMLACLFTQGQWKYQLGLGWNLNTGDERVSATMSDTLRYNFLKEGLTYVSASFMATHPITGKSQLRMGVAGAKSYFQIEVYDTKNEESRYFEQRSVTDLHIPIEIQYELFKGLFVNGGFSVNGRLAFFRPSTSAYVAHSPPYAQQEYEVAAYESIREVSTNYCVGTTVLITHWLALDMMYDRPMMNLIKRPFVVNEDSRDIKFNYSTFSFRVVWILDWQKVKAVLNS